MNTVTEQLAQALAELVAVKDLKIKSEKLTLDCPASVVEYDNTQREYLRRQPVAWIKARDALAAWEAEKSKGPTMDDAIAAGDGTLHGAIDYWQKRALKAEKAAATPSAGAVEWTPGPNEWKDWCSRWFGPDADDAYLSKAVHDLPPMGQKFARKATPSAEPLTEAIEKLAQLSVFLLGWRGSQGCINNEMQPTVDRWREGLQILFDWYDESMSGEELAGKDGA